MVCKPLIYCKLYIVYSAYYKYMLLYFSSQCLQWLRCCSHKSFQNSRTGNQTGNLTTLHCHPCAGETGGAVSRPNVLHMACCGWERLSTCVCVCVCVWALFWLASDVRRYQVINFRETLHYPLLQGQASIAFVGRNCTWNEALWRWRRIEARPSGSQHQQGRFDWPGCRYCSCLFFSSWCMDDCSLKKFVPQWPLLASTYLPNIYVNLEGVGMICFPAQGLVKADRAWTDFTLATWVAWHCLLL